MAVLQKQILSLIKALLGLAPEEPLPTYQLVAAVASIFCAMAGIMLVSFGG